MDANAQRVEVTLRRSLGIPEDAERVLILAESSHWDPNWLYTSEEYFDRFVCRNLDLAIRELRREPRRVYSIECVFFLRMYWDRCPEQRESVRWLVNQRRMRLTSCGVTTADTLLPSVEAILRDFLIGQEWLRANGITQEPRLAYFADSFGSSPALPSLLVSAGFDRTAITRVDGMFFMGCDLELPRNFPRPGSSAEHLLNKQRTLDFVWQDRNGAEVLCHWNAFTYGQGDLLAHRGLSRVYLIPVAYPDRSERNVARRIAHFVAQLAPVSPTPYLFCPIGFDFVPPIPDLVALLDRYNRVRYPTTGTWVVNAGLDDYLDLVDCHRNKLPRLELDPNPYWTGFYTARPSLKKRCHELVDALLLAERLSLLPVNEGADRRIGGELEEAWWTAVVANHHDFITGTSPDEVVEKEQIPWLEHASSVAMSSVRNLTPDPLKTGGRCRRAFLPEWTRRDGSITVQTPHYVLELAEGTGGAFLEGTHLESGKQFLVGLSNDLVCYRDSGGLWRMGHEYRGGELREVARASDQQARLNVTEHEGGIEISCLSEFAGDTVERRMWFEAGSPLIRLRIEGRAPERHTITVRFQTDVSTSMLVMGTPGGVVNRPIQKIYQPTFWPFQDFVFVRDFLSGHGMAILQPLPGAVAYKAGGEIEIVALRNATRERAFGLLPLPANPATGHERDISVLEYALLFTREGGWLHNDLQTHALLMRHGPWMNQHESDLVHLAASVVKVNRPDVWVSAAKPASRGEGLVVRLRTVGGRGIRVGLSVQDRSISQACLCDARERDLEPIEVSDQRAYLSMPGSIATVRLVC